MPSTMQQSMVSTRAMIMWPPERLTMVLSSLEARPVTVMQPEMMPATPQATATVMEPLMPPSRASRNLVGVIRFSLLMRPTTMATAMAMEALKAMV